MNEIIFTIGLLTCIFGGIWVFGKIADYFNKQKLEEKIRENKEKEEKAKHERAQLILHYNSLYGGAESIDECEKLYWEILVPETRKRYETLEQLEEAIIKSYEIRERWKAFHEEICENPKKDNDIRYSLSKAL